MTRKIVPITALLSLALALGACGGGGTDAADPVATDPVATDPTAAEPLAVETMDATESVTAAAEDVATDVGEGWTAMQGDWQTSAGLVKDRWSELTEEEILGTGGDRDQLVGLVQEKYGLERDQAEQEVSDWAATF